jgi:heme/copper-type cytochrome/quinol oxidase subunit 4
MEKIKEWLSPSTSPSEQTRPLLGNGNGNGNTGYFTDQNETDIDDEAYASSSDFPSGYAAHYAAFPSIRDQKFSQGRERLLFHATIACFVASAILFLIASLLMATGKHKLRVEVDVGAIIGVVSSLFFATLGLGMMLYRAEDLGWLHKSCVMATFTAICLLNGMLLVLVVGNSGS